MNLPTFKLLIVEDFLADRELYQRALLADTDYLYQPIVAESIAEGLELCRTQQIDGILLDYLLPDGDGLEFLETLLIQNNGLLPPTVVMTGHGNEQIAVRAMKLGAQDYLIKSSFTPELLRRSLRKAIETVHLQQQLRTANQRTIEIWESMTDAYVTVDGQWRLLYANPMAIQVISRLTDLEPAAFLGRSHWDLFPVLVGGEVEREYRRALTDRVAVHVEVWFEPTGSWFEVHLYPAVEGVGIYFRDITERKQNEMVRIEAERERDRFFNLSLDLLAVGSFEGYFLRLSPSFEKLFGYTDAEFMAQPFIDFVHPDDREITIIHAAGLSEGDKVINFENRYRCKDGSYRWISWSATPYAQSNVWYAIGHDVTDRKIADAVIRESESKFSAIFNQTFALVGLLSLDGVVLEVNQTALNSVAATPNEIVGQNFWDTPWWTHSAQLQQQLKNAIAQVASGQFVRFEMQYPSRSGESVGIDFSLKPVVDESGQVTMMLAEGHNITARVQAQAALEQRNQELDRFVYVVAHDLKAPLRAIANLSQWIEDDLADVLTQDTQSQMTLLRSRVARMGATIDGLLEYARVGQLETKIESVEMRALLAEAIDALAPATTFTIAIADNLPNLEANRLSLFQVFLNLVGNGITHHDRSDGSIQICVRERDDFYEFTVADDGPGIAPEQHERIFEIFKAVNPQNRPDSTGIGLAIVKKIIEVEGGTIWLESVLGLGTTFHFTWPKRSPNRSGRVAIM